MSTAAGNLDGYVIAPDDETTAQATKRLGKFKQLKAFYLLPKVAAPAYAGSRLTIKFDITVFTYPGKAMKGMIPVSSAPSWTRAPRIPRRKTSSSSRPPKARSTLFAKNAERFE